MAQLTFEQFKATKAKPTDEDWDNIFVSAPGVARDTCHVYADNYLIHEADDQFWVHAWWYAPIGYETLAIAEEKLYPWYQELAE